MNILSAEKITKSYGTKVLFNDLSFGIDSDEKLGLIGVNGTGKSTLLKILVGIEKPDSGRIAVAKNIRIGYLPQNPQFPSEYTVLQAVINNNSLVQKLCNDYSQITKSLELHPEDISLQQQLLLLNQKMEETGVWQIESDAKTILTKLGIEAFDAKINSLSGGQRKRVGLAATLLNPVDLLIMDEPTNQIDNQTVDWLEQFLKQRVGAVLMVTHDRYFLDRVANGIFELSCGEIYIYSGNYSLFLEKKAEREELEDNLAAKRENLYRRELAWIRRGAKARSTKQQARIERFEKIQEQLVEGVNNDQIQISAGTSRLGKKVISLEHIEKSFFGKKIIADFNYIFLPNDRVGIIGPNGSGKSTLLNLISKTIKPDRGIVDIGQTVKFGFFTQEHIEMNENLRVIEYLKEQAEFLHTKDGGVISASQLLEHFLFNSTLQWSPISKLSGGEKRRLYLLRILMSAPNILLLDEPTNDLDTQTLSVLEEYLKDFPGVVITVSHDRYFLDRTVKKLIILEKDRKIQYLTGDYSYYLETKKSEINNEKPLNTGINKKNSVNQEKNSAERKQTRKLSYNEQREFEKIESVITEIEQQLNEIKQAINSAGNDYAKLQELILTQEELEQKLNVSLERWAYLSEIVEEYEKNKRSL